VPARRKFLKSGRTELFHIEETVRNLALAHPETEFSLQDEQRTILRLMPANLEKRVRDIFHYQKNLLPLTHHSEHLFSLTVQGFLLLPDSISSSRTSRLRTLVNDRPVQDTMVLRAVSEGLHGFLMKGQQPAGALLISIDPEQVDVNVHPAKREIRFRNAQAVFQLLKQTTIEAVRRYQDTVRTDLFTSQTSPEPQTQEDLISQTQPEPVLPATPSTRPEQRNITSYPQSSIISREQSREPVAPSSPVMNLSAAEIFSDQNEPQQLTSSAPALEGMTLVGQLFNLYLLYEKNEQMIIIDQHAAHERILYQNLRKGYLTNTMPGQNLMFPVTVELLPDQVETIEKYPKELTDLGLTVEHFGDATWVIKSVPAMISHLNPKDILPEILDTLQTGKQKELSGTIPKSIDTILASMACKAAIKAGNKLTPQEMTALLVQMEDSEFFSHCPHGRPVIKTFAKNEIEKWFHRL
jgi:DNA mismatch repair protein MutL